MAKIKFSSGPYYDDFDSTKNYQRVLFKPKNSIQVRELNQLQSIFSNQIETFADHIFKFGSRVDAGSVKYFDSVDYVSLEESDIDFTNMIGRKFKGLSTGLTAIVLTYAPEEEIDKVNNIIENNTLYISYVGGGDTLEVKFRDGEIIESIDDYKDTYTISSVGKGTTFAVSEATYYVYGHFVTCLPQTIVLSKFDKNPTYKIGLLINQSIVTSKDDKTLLDNAIGTSNYGAPGADRYKIELTLTKKNIDAVTDENFIELAKVRDGKLTEVLNKPQYSEISKMIAKRTYDESGDYTVKPFTLSFEENETDSTKYNITISPGKAYVKGYEIEKQTNTHLIADKSYGSEGITKNVNIDYNNRVLYTLNPMANLPNFTPNVDNTYVSTTKHEVDINTYINHVYDLTSTYTDYTHKALTSSTIGYIGDLNGDIFVTGDPLTEEPYFATSTSTYYDSGYINYGAVQIKDINTGENRIIYNPEIENGNSTKNIVWLFEPTGSDLSTNLQDRYFHFSLEGASWIYGEYWNRPKDSYSYTVIEGHTYYINDVFNNKFYKLVFTTYDLDPNGYGTVEYTRQEIHRTTGQLIGTPINVVMNDTNQFVDEIGTNVSLAINWNTAYGIQMIGFINPIYNTEVTNSSLNIDPYNYYEDAVKYQPNFGFDVSHNNNYLFVSANKPFDQETSYYSYQYYGNVNNVEGDKVYIFDKNNNYELIHEIISDSPVNDWNSGTIYSNFGYRLASSDDYLVVVEFVNVESAYYNYRYDVHFNVKVYSTVDWSKIHDFTLPNSLLTSHYSFFPSKWSRDYFDGPLINIHIDKSDGKTLVIAMEHGEQIALLNYPAEKNSSVMAFDLSTTINTDTVLDLEQSAIFLIDRNYTDDNYIGVHGDRISTFGVGSNVLVNNTTPTSDLINNNYYDVKFEFLASRETTAINGDYILIGEPGYDAEYNGSYYKSSGAAYLYDRSGTLLHTFTHPEDYNEPDVLQLFGFSVALNDNFIYISTISDHDWNHPAANNYTISPTGAIYVFSLHTYELLDVIRSDPYTQNYDNYMYKNFYGDADQFNTYMNNIDFLGNSIYLNNNHFIASANNSADVNSIYNYHNNQQPYDNIELNYGRYSVWSVTDTSTGNVWEGVPYFGNPEDNKFTTIDATGTYPLDGTFMFKSYEKVDDETYYLNYFDFNGTINENFTTPFYYLHDTATENTLINSLGSDVSTISNIVFIEGGVEVNAILKTKTLKEKTITHTTSISDETISLLQADCVRIVSITNVTQSKDYTNNYKLNINSSGNYYEYSSIDVRSIYYEWPTAGDVLSITFEYYEWGNTATGHCFVKDSYIGVDYINFPSFESYNLRDCIDFRPLKLPTGEILYANGTPDDMSIISFDAEYYRSRIDVLSLTDTGRFIITTGQYSDNPKAPKIPDNAMPIYTIDYLPNTLNLYNDIFPKFIENKRYTMSDIYQLEKNIENLETYVTLNLLERDLDTMEIFDANGNKRYKNGYITDNFDSLKSANVTSKDYQAGVDVIRKELRPSFKKRDVKLAFDESKSDHYQVTGDVVTLPYADVEYVKQPYNTKTISINPYFVFASKGNMDLSPSNDVWTDTVNDPPVKVNIDTGVDMARTLASEVGLTGTFWNEPKITKEVISSSQSESTSSASRTRTVATAGRSQNGQLVRRTTTTTTVTTTQTDRIRETRDFTGDKVTLEGEINDYSVGNVVNNVELLTYTRSTDVYFSAAGLKGNTQVYFFFEGVDVTEDVRPVSGVFGTPMITSETGSISGIFRIPNREGKRFYVGTGTFRITNSKTNSDDQDELLCFAEAQYHSGGLVQDKNDRILSVTSPVFVHTPVTKTLTSTYNESRVVGSTSSASTRDVALPLRPRVVVNRFGRDPVAQSFKIENEENGVFLTKIDTYFSEVGTKGMPCWLEVREMVNGYPGPKLIPYGRIYKNADAISVSEDGSIPTTWTFESPLYLSSQVEYCFVIGGNDPDYRIHICKLGDTDVLTNTVVEEQPHMGSMFKGQNNRTWNASQYEDIKFILYKAKFDISSQMKVSFVRDDIGTKEPMSTNAFETVTDSYDIRVRHLNHGFSVGDKVTINLLEDNTFDLLIVSGDITEGQTITGANGQFKVKEATYVGTDELTGYEKYSIQPEDLFGYFSDNETVNGLPYYPKIPPKLNIYSIDDIPTTIDPLVAILPDGIDNTFNGISLSALSKKAHTITGVDSLDTFTITLNEKASETGKIGGLGNYLYPNIVFDAMNLSVSDIDFAGTGTWYYDSVRYSGIGSILQNNLAITGQYFVKNNFTELEMPIKMNTATNDKLKYIDGSKSFYAIGQYESLDENVSPIINTSNCVIKTFGNRIEWNDADTHLDWIEETNSLGEGSEKAKYCTLPVRMTDSANDIRIICDINCQDEGDVIFYYRTLDEQSYDDILDEDWIKIDPSSFILTKVDDRTTFIEHEINIPDVAGLELPNFKAYQIKIVLKTRNTSKPPRIKKLRCIATT